MTITEHSRGDIVVLETSGKLSDLRDTVEVLQAVLCLPPNKLRRVVFILTKPLSISRDGFRTLAHCYGHVITNGGRFAFVGSLDDKRAFIQYSGLPANVPYYRTEEEAIASFCEEKGDAA